MIPDEGIDALVGELSKGEGYVHDGYRDSVGRYVTLDGRWSFTEIAAALEAALPHPTGWSDDDVLHDPRCRCLEPSSQERIKELERERDDLLSMVEALRGDLPACDCFDGPGCSRCRDQPTGVDRNQGDE